MTSQFDFSNEQWVRLVAAPVMVGMAVAKAEDSGFLGSRRESRTLVDEIATRAETHPAGSLIAQAAAAETDEVYERCRVAGAEALAVDAVEVCRELTSVLASVATPEESAGFRGWVFEVAQAVASAAKEGGERVSPGEADLLGRIEVALHLGA